MGFILKTHGLPKDGHQKWVIRLFNSGATLFSGRKQLHFRPQLAIEESAWREQPLGFPVEAKGGKFDSCGEILVRLPLEKFPEPKGYAVGVPRADFPRLPEGEFYLCDLLGFELQDENAAPLGSVRGFTEVPVPRGPAQYLVEVGGLHEFSLPFEWLDLVSPHGVQLLQSGRVRAEGARAWMTPKP